MRRAENRVQRQGKEQWSIGCRW